MTRRGHHGRLVATQLIGGRTRKQHPRLLLRNLHRHHSWSSSTQQPMLGTMWTVITCTQSPTTQAGRHSMSLRAFVCVCVCAAVGTINGSHPWRSCTKSHTLFQSAVGQLVSCRLFAVFAHFHPLVRAVHCCYRNTLPLWLCFRPCSLRCCLCDLRCDTQPWVRCVVCVCVCVCGNQ